MKRSEQILAYGLGAAIALVVGAKGVHSTFIEPINTSRSNLVDINKSISTKMDQLVDLMAQQKKLKEWSLRSLPPDPTKTGQRPNALNAQRLYQDWLHDLALLSGFEDLKISPGSLGISAGNVYVSVPVRIEADARFDQLCHFLDRFYRVDLLHRISSLRATSKESEGNPFLQIVMDAEGLAIVKAPEKSRLFPQTTLVEGLSDEATVLEVDSAEGFPTKPGFMVRLRSEFLTVTAMDGTKWTVERARDDTVAATHAAQTILQLNPIHPNYVARTPDDFKQLIAGNVFVKPAPPVQYSPKFGPLGDKSFTRGKPIEFNIVALGFDPSKGRPEFALVSPQITGMKVDKSTGKFSWSPVSEHKTGTYPVKFEARHPSAAGGRLQGSFNLVVRDPNTPPKISTKTVPKVYLGREWKFVPEATDAESAASRLTWKLGDNPPKGMKINPRTGEMTWKPDDTVEVGDTTVQVVATDDGIPPQSSTFSLRLKVEDDIAMFTKLIGIMIDGQNIRALLYDQSQGKMTELRIGKQFAVADVHGTVTKIDKRFLLFDDDQLVRRLEVGQSLRETVAEASDVADALRPVNVVPEK